MFQNVSFGLSLTPAQQPSFGCSQPVYFCGKDATKDSVTISQTHSKSPRKKMAKITAPIPTAFDSKLLNSGDVIFFDLETTGLNSRFPISKQDKTLDEVFEIGAVRYRNGVEVDRLHTYVKTQKSLPDIVEKLTGYTNEHIQKVGIDVKSAFTQFADFVGDKPVILAGKNIRKFDVYFVREMLNRLDLAHLKNRFDYDSAIDLDEVAEKRFPGSTWFGRKKNGGKALPGEPENLKQESLAKHYGIANLRGHQADNDADVSKQVYDKMVADIQGTGVSLKTYGDLYRYQFKKRSFPIDLIPQGFTDFFIPKRVRKPKKTASKKVAPKTKA